jgi:hypothetical protein
MPRFGGLKKGFLNKEEQPVAAHAEQPTVAQPANFPVNRLNLLGADFRGITVHVPNEGGEQMPIQINADTLGTLNPATLQEHLHQRVADGDQEATAHELPPPPDAADMSPADQANAEEEAEMVAAYFRQQMIDAGLGHVPMEMNLEGTKVTLTVHTGQATNA